MPLRRASSGYRVVHSPGALGGRHTRVPRYRCGRYEYIKDQPFADMVPAFGGGCCSTINEDRDLIVLALRRRDGPGFLRTSGELLAEIFSGARLPKRP